MSERNAQIFYPPYLFNGPRPRIDGAPATATYGQQFSVEWYILGRHIKAIGCHVGVGEKGLRISA